LQLACCWRQRHLRHPHAASGTSRITGTVTAFCRVIARPNGSNGSGRDIAVRFIGMVTRVFTAAAGTAVASVPVGRRRRSGRCGTAVDNGCRPGQTKREGEKKIVRNESGRLSSSLAASASHQAALKGVSQTTLPARLDLLARSNQATFDPIQAAWGLQPATTRASGRQHRRPRTRCPN
jgi:hypothetical protein